LEDIVRIDTESYYPTYRQVDASAEWLGLRAAMIEFDQFLAVDMRVGRVLEVHDFPEARKPAWKLTIDFGPEIGVKRSSAQVTNYPREALEGRLVVAVVNFPPRQIGPVRSEVLCLGASDSEGRVILLAPDAEVPLGSRIH
jgi:tRNA-binding protein